MQKLLLIFILLTCSFAVNATIFYVDPATGNINNTGTIVSPWDTLQNVLASGKIETKDKNGVVKFPNAPIKAGDTIKLLTGYHGKIYYRNSYNEVLITIEAESGHTPKLSQLEIHSAKNLVFKGLTISPTFDSANYTGKLVIFCTNTFLGSCENITLKDSYIFSKDNTYSWSAADWVNYSINGVLIGAGSTNFNISNNYIENVKKGIDTNSSNTTIDGNVVSNYAADGIRVGAEDVTIRYNIIKNNYKVDGNHPDAIQGYMGSNGIQNTIISNNIIIEKEDPLLKFPGSLQGIGYFNGPLRNIVVYDNAVNVNSHHGISLYDSVNSLIADNVVFKDAESLLYPNTRLNTKGLLKPTGNIVQNNYSSNYDLSVDKSKMQFNNLLSTESDYAEKFNSILTKINTVFGETHILACKKRISEEYLAKYAN